jgi:hypothetical protein
MYADNEILFPPYAIPQLKDTRGDVWRNLVERVIRLPEDHPESLAFSLMMIRLDGCLSCETDSYRAMRGCVACAKQTLRRFKGPDEDLLERFNKALNDVKVFLDVDVETVEMETVSAQAA